jgi:hypothetical protein
MPSAAAAKGPRSDNLVIQYYETVESAYAALKARDIDAVGYEITADLFTDATGDANLVVAPVADSGFYEVDVNNNHTIPTYPGVESPTHYTGFRQALAWLTDKDFIAAEICGGFVERIDQMVAAPYKGWANASMWYPNYPYEYNPADAATALDAEGWAQGTTPNPDHDGAFPGSATHIRTYPPGHSKAGQDLDPVVCAIRTDDVRRLEAGRLLAGNMRKHGIPTDDREGPSADLYPMVMGDFDYHIYTGGWSVGRFPPITFYGLYHSTSYYSYGPNYSTGYNATGGFNYEEPLMRFLEGGRYPDTYEEAVGFCKLAGGYMTEIALNIPLWSTKSYWTWSVRAGEALLGVVNMEGAGPENGYTFMNAYKEDDTAIRYGTKTAPNAMNIIYSSWYYDYQNLDRMNIYGGVDVPPYDLSADQAGLVTDWTIGTWIDPDDAGNKSKISMTWRSDAFFTNASGGDQLEQLNASHYAFSAWYCLQVNDGWNYDSFLDLKKVIQTGDYSFDIYFDTGGYWNVYYCQGPILPMDHWTQLSPQLTSGVLTEAFEEGVDLTTPGPLTLGDLPLFIKRVTNTDTATDLVKGTDYYIKSGTLHFDINLPATTNIEVEYIGIDETGFPAGYTPANLGWELSFVGGGAWYATNFVGGPGGTLALSRSAHFYMETPLLGEIDFVKKPNGCYKIDIFDVVKAAAAYGSQGTGVPDLNWLPGADVAPPGGTINIFDIVTITGKYGQEFDCPP